MKVLKTNEVKNATISALTPNPNFPASNLSHVFAKLKYKGEGYSDTITVMFPDNVKASGFFYTFSNASSITVRLYSNASDLLDTVTVDCTYQSGAEYFDEYDNVRWIEIDIASPVAEDVYLGGIAFGEVINFPLPLISFGKSLKDNSSKTESSDGQTSYHYIKPLLSYVLPFSHVVREEYHELVEFFEEVGGGHIWVDITEEDHSVYQPLYCTSNLIEFSGREEFYITFKITLMEAR